MIQFESWRVLQNSPSGHRTANYIPTGAQITQELARGCAESQSVPSTAIRKLNIQLCISSANSDQHLAVAMETISSTATQCSSERADEFQFNYGGFLHGQPLINYPYYSIDNNREASMEINQGLATRTMGKAPWCDIHHNSVVYSNMQILSCCYHNSQDSQQSRLVEIIYYLFATANKCVCVCIC